MGTHLIPRANVKGQDRIFIFFSFQGLIGTLIGAIIGYPFYLIINGITHEMLVALAIEVMFCIVGFTIGQGKVPDNNGSPIFKKLGGLYIRDVFVIYFKFKKSKAKYELQVSENEVFDDREETKIEKFLTNKPENNNNATA